jgi:hypothetical protein
VACSLVRKQANKPGTCAGLPMDKTQQSQGAFR